MMNDRQTDGGPCRDCFCVRYKVGQTKRQTFVQYMKPLFIMDFVPVSLSNDQYLYDGINVME